VNLIGAQPLINNRRQSTVYIDKTFCDQIGLITELFHNLQYAQLILFGDLWFISANLRSYSNRNTTTLGTSLMGTTGDAPTCDYGRPNHISRVDENFGYL
jgi:hypothetical protein